MINTTAQTIMTVAPMSELTHASGIPWTKIPRIRRTIPSTRHTVLAFTGSFIRKTTPTFSPKKVLDVSDEVDLQCEERIYFFLGAVSSTLRP